MRNAQAQTRPPELLRAHRRALNLSWSLSGSNAPLSPCFIYRALSRTGRQVSASSCTPHSHSQPDAVYVPVKPTRCPGCFVPVSSCVGTSPRLFSVLLCFAGEARLGGKVVVGAGREMQWRMNGGKRRRGAWRCAKAPDLSFARCPQIRRCAMLWALLPARTAPGHACSRCNETSSPKERTCVILRTASMFTVLSRRKTCVLFQAWFRRGCKISRSMRLLRVTHEKMFRIALLWPIWRTTSFIDPCRAVSGRT